MKNIALIFALIIPLSVYSSPHWQRVFEAPMASEKGGSFRTQWPPFGAASVAVYEAVKACPQGFDIIRQSAINRDDGWYMQIEIKCH